MKKKIWAGLAIIIAMELGVRDQMASNVSICYPTYQWCDAWVCNTGTVNSPGTISKTSDLICVGMSVVAPTNNGAITFNNDGSKSQTCHNDCGANWTSGPYPLSYSPTNWWLPAIPTGPFGSPGVQSYTNYVRGLTSDTDCGTPTATVVAGIYTVTVLARPTIITQPTNRTACPWDSTAFSVVAGGTNLTYQWLHAGTNLPGKTSATLTINPVASTDAGTYQVIISNGGCTTNSAVVTLTVTTPQAYVVLSGSYSNYTFRSDTTYYFPSSVTLFGTNVFEGGAVLKFAPNVTLNLINLSAPVLKIVTLGTEFRPTIFTAKDDDSVGLTICGSTGNPQGYYADTAMYIPGGNSQAVGYCRFLYAKLAMSLPGTQLVLSHSQIINGGRGLLGAGTTIDVQNVLFANVQTNFDLSGGTTVKSRNATFAISRWLASYSNTNSTILQFTNCVFSDVTNLWSQIPGAFGHQYNGFFRTTPFGGVALTNTFYPFRTVGAGNYYLTTNVVFRDAGTTNIDSTLLMELRKRTTWPPVIRTNLTYSTPVLWTIQAPRDINTPDLGYHYDALDYAFNNVNLAPGGSLTLTNGVSIAAINGIYWGISMDNETKFTSIGIPQAHNFICTYQAVQEQPINWGGGYTLAEVFFTSAWELPPTEVEARYTDFTGFLGLQYRDILVGDMMKLNMRDCRVGAGAFYCYTFGTSSSDTNLCANNIFERTHIIFSEMDGDSPLEFYNNLVRFGDMVLERYTTLPWSVYDNLFESTGIILGGSSPAGLTNHHNAYFNTTAMANPGPGNITLTEVDYRTGPLGTFYYPTNGTQLLTLVNAGSRTADLAGLYDYTTSLNQRKETNSVVDIGFHYAVDPTVFGPYDITMTYGGQGGTFFVQATGFGPLTYQWKWNGTNVTGATNPWFAVPNPRVLDSGSKFSVVVSDSLTSVTSREATLTVLRAPLTITADNKARPYRGANPPLTWTPMGFVNGETSSVLSGAPTLSCTATNSSNCGNYPITITNGTLSAANYTFVFDNGVLSVVKVPLTLTADNKTRLYGDANPTLTWQIGGFINGETISVVSGTPDISVSALSTSPVGVYPIVLAQGTLSATNYSFVCVNGTLTINPATLTVTAQNASRLYGAPNPAFTASYSGFKVGETIDILTGGPLLTTTAVSNSAAGTYTITAAPGSLMAPNYTLAFVNGVLTITKASLDVLADNKISYSGENPPALTFTFVGLTAGDGPGAISGAPALTTGVTSSSPPGNYTITNKIGTLSSGNYSFILHDGILSNLPPSSQITFSNDTTFYLLGSPPEAMDPSMSVVARGSASFSNAVLTASFVGGKEGDILTVLDAGIVPGQVTVTNTTSGSDPYLVKWGTTNVCTFTPGSPTNDMVCHFLTNGTPGLVQIAARNMAFFNRSTSPSTIPRHVKCSVTVSNVTCPPVTNIVYLDCPDRIYTVLILDKTSSMGTADVGTTNVFGSNRLAVAKSAAISYLGFPEYPADSVKVLAFCGDPGTKDNPTNITSGFLTNYVSLSNAIAGIRDIDMCGNTIYHPSLQAAYTNLANLTNEGTLRLILFLTDGELSPDSAANRQAAMSLAATNRSVGIRTITIGLGGGIGASTTVGTNARALLRQLASEPRDFVMSTNGAGLNSVFSDAARFGCRTTNLPPVVNAGPNTTNIYGTLPGVYTLHGTATDDGLPTPPQLTNLWTQIGGPPFGSFNDRTILNPSVTFTQVGVYTFQLFVSDKLLSATSTVTITVQQVVTPPTVFIVTPVQGQVFTAPTTIKLTSVASDSIGTITNVSYYRGTNGTFLGSTNLFPYPLKLTNVLQGSYQFVAVAMNDRGLSATSSAVNVTVLPVPPKISIIVPQVSNKFALGEPILIQAEASDVDGIVTNVQFFSGSTLLGNDTTSPYTFTWNSAPQTILTNIIAIAKDNDGLTATSTVPIIVQPACVSYGVSNLVLSLTEVAGGTSLSGTIILSNAATTGGQAVTVYVTNSSAIVPASVFIPQGQRTNTFTIDTIPVTATNTVWVHAYYHQPNQAVARSFRVLPADGGPLTPDDTNQLSGLFTTDLDVLTPEALVREIVGPDVQFSNVRYTGHNRAAGVFHGGSGIFGFEGGLILSSGDITNVIGPNSSSSDSVSNGQPGDPELNAQIGGFTLDAAILEFDFVPSTEAISWDYVFGSEEYNEWVFSYNDVFAFFLNGTNVALLPNGTPVAIDNVNNVYNTLFYRDNSDRGPGGTGVNAPFNTEMDGFTAVLTVLAHVNPGVTNHIKLAIADTSDDALDSVVMIRTRSFTTAGTVIYTRDDLTRQYTPFSVTNGQSGGVATNAGRFDFKGVRGAVTGARIERGGALQFTAGSRYDFEIGVGTPTKDLNMIITTVAGDHNLGGTYVGDNGPALSAGLSSPHGIGFYNGNLMIADTGNSAIRLFSSSGWIYSTLGSNNNFVSPLGVDLDGNGYTYVADGDWGSIREFQGGNDPITLDGHMYLSCTMDNSGNLYGIRGNGNIVTKMHIVLPYGGSPDGIVTTIAGNGTAGYSGDGGAATSASLNVNSYFSQSNDPIVSSLTLDNQGNVYIAEVGNNVIRKVNTSGIISTVAGNYALGGGFSGDGGPAVSARLLHPSAVAVDAVGNLYIADTGNHRIRRVDTCGNITTLVGTGEVGYSGDNGPAMDATLSSPCGLAFDAAGNLFISDTGNDVIRKVTGLPALACGASAGPLTGSFGLLFANAQTLTATNYLVQWPLPPSFYQGIGASLDRTYSLRLTNRVSSICGATYVATDSPEADWPFDKNILSVSVTADRVVPRGRCRDFVLNANNAPLNGTWDIVFRDQVVASSGNPNGWDVEEDHTAFNGFLLTVPESAQSDFGYEVRVRLPGWIDGRSTRFTVLPRGAIVTAPVLKPLVVASNMISGSSTMLLTVSLDGPAPFGDAHVVLRTNGLGGCVVPREVIIPAGQTSVSNSITVPGGTLGTLEILASFNGYRKASVRVVGSCSAPPVPVYTAVTNLDAAVYLAWTSVSVNNRYDVSRSLNGTNFTVIFAGLTTNVFIDTDVLPAITYHYRVTVLSNLCGTASVITNVSVPYPIVAPAPWIIPFGGNFHEHGFFLVTNVVIGAKIICSTNDSPEFTFNQGGFISISTNTTIKARTPTDLIDGTSAFTFGSPTVEATFTIIHPTPIKCGDEVTDTLTSTNAYSTIDGPGYYSARYSITDSNANLVIVTVHSDEFDSFLELENGNGDLKGWNDDYVDGSGDSRIVFRGTPGATNIIEVTTYFAGEVGEYTVTIECRQAAEMNVFTDDIPILTTNAAPLPNYGLIDFGVIFAGVPATNYVLITNVGSAPLVISNIAVFPTGATNANNGFFVVPTNKITVLPNGFTNLAVSLLSTQIANFHGYLYFENNDDGAGTGRPETPFYTELKGMVRAAPGPPFVSILFPTNGMFIPATNSIITNVVLEIDAVAMDEDGISNVAFYVSYPGTPFAIVSNFPYIAYWTNPPAGIQTITAKAWDLSHPQLSAVTNVTINVGLATLTLAPTNSCVGLSNRTFTATATLRNATNGVVPGSNVVFTVSGAHNFSATNITAANGQASMTYTGIFGGRDRIIASVVVNGLTIQSDPIFKDWAIRIGCSSTNAGALTISDGYSFGCGCSIPSHYTDFYSITGAVNDIITFTMTSTNFSTFMFLLDTNCTRIPFAVEALNAMDSQMQVKLPSNGTYIVEATSIDIFQTGNYKLGVVCGLPTVPDIAVLTLGTNFPNASLIDLGTTTNGVPVTQVITITNKGGATLNITALAWYRNLTNMFSITPSPITSLASGAAATFTLQFQSTNIGQFSDALILTNNDPDENPFIINITVACIPDGAPPYVVVTAPTNGTKYIAPAIVTVNASATPFGTGVTITNVAFGYKTAQGAFFIANDPTSPYSIDWGVQLPGTYSLMAAAWDSEGRIGFSTNIVNIEVSASTANRPPVAVTDYVSVLANSTNNVFRCLTNDFDPDGDPLMVIHVTPPLYGTAGIVDNGKAVRYTPKYFTQGTDGFSYDVSDGHGGVTRGRIWITIEAADPPRLTITNPPAGSQLSTGYPTNVMVRFDSEITNIVKVEYFLGPNKIGEVTTPPFNVFQWQVRDEFCECGLHAEATDRFGQVGSSDPVSYTFANTSGWNPKAEIDSPAEGTYLFAGKFPEVHTTIVDDGILVVTGSVYDLQVSTSITKAAEYKVLIKDIDGKIIRDTGWLPPKEIHHGVIITNDLTTLRNDEYDLELVVRNDYATARKTIRFALNSNLKIGPFTFSEQDLAIPVSGLPLTVVRTYNSMNPAAGDFGYSWTYAINEMDVRIHETRVPRQPLFDDEEGPLPGGKFSLRVAGNRDVTLTLPDGRRTTFYYYEVPGECNEGDSAGSGALIQLCAKPKYQAAAGIRAELRPVDKYGNDLGGYDFYTKVWKSAGGQTTHENFDFPGFILKTSDGTEYYLKRDFQGDFLFLPDDSQNEDDGFGETTKPNNFFVAAYDKPRLAEIRQKSGDKIIINPDTPGGRFSVDHRDPSGNLTRSIYFQRDDQGRITAIMDPISGSTGLPVVKYEYDDSANNLIRVLKLQNRNSQTYATNTYLYENSSFPHYLTKILDARGVPIARNLYDDAGKIIGIIDAMGRTNLFVHDISGRTETVFDRMGIPTVCGYDTRGNLTMTINALGGTKRYTYNDQNELLSSTDALTNTSYFEYNTKGFRTQAVDPLNRTNLFTYDGDGNLLSHIDPAGNRTEKYYDSAGNLTNTVYKDPANNVVKQSSSTYENSHARELRDGNNRTIDSFGYDSTGNLSSVTNATGFSGAFTYDANGNPTTTAHSARKADGTLTTLTTSTAYDATGRETVTVGMIENTNITVYNALGKPDYSVDNLNQTNSFLYDTRGFQIQSVSPFGTNRTVYDDNGNVILSTDLNGITGTSTEYDVLGRPVRVVRVMNARIDIVADPFNSGQLQSTIGVAGTPYSTNSTEYYLDGKVKKRIAPNGATTTYEYWPDGQKMSITDALTNRTLFFYDEAGRQTAMIDPLNRVTRSVYDAMGHRMAMIYADGSTTTNEFNNLGQLVGMIDQAGLRTQFKYNVSGLVTNVVKPDVFDPEISSQPVTPEWKYKYDERGQLLVMTDPKGRSVTNNFDEFGRCVTRQLTMGQTSSNVFNSKGQLWKQYDYKGQYTEFVYDTSGRIKAKFLFNFGAAYPSNSVCYQYNQLGQLSRVTERYDQDASTNTCDGYMALVGIPPEIHVAFVDKVLRVCANAGPWVLVFFALCFAMTLPGPTRLRRLATEFYLRGGWRLEPLSSEPMKRRLRLPSLWCRAVTVVLLITFIGNDRTFDHFFTARAQCTFPVNTSNLTMRITDFAYDIDGHLTQANCPEGVINYGYDLATGQHLSTCTTNTFLSYGYDELGRMKTVTISKRNSQTIAPETTTYTYDAVGNRSTMKLPNNVTTVWKYDALNRLTNVVQQSGSTNLASYSYQLHLTGRRAGAQEILWQEGGTYLTNTFTWQYDAMYRLTNEMSSCSSTGGAYTNSYQYDLVGNRLKKTLLAGANITTVTNAYDKSDRLLKEVTLFNGPATGTNYYAYDPNGSVTGRTNIGVGTTTYTYNLANKLSSVALGGIVQASYQYNDQGIRVRATQSTNTYYLIDENNHTGFAQVLEELGAIGATPNTSYVLGDDVLGQCGTDRTDPRWLLYDGHGSTRQLADKDANATSHYTYDAYGTTIATSTTSAETKMLYTGEQYDPTLKMYNLRARFYDPSNGRFNQMDSHPGSLLDPQSLHKYLYAHCDPVNGVDPSGNSFILEFVASTFIRAVIAGLVLGAISFAFTWFKTKSFGAAALAFGMTFITCIGAAVSPLAAVCFLIGGLGSMALTVWAEGLSKGDAIEIAVMMVVGIVLHGAMGKYGVGGFDNTIPHPNELPRPIRTFGPGEVPAEGSKRLLYAVTEDQQLLFGDPPAPVAGRRTPGHYDMVQGKPVLAAGECEFWNGMLLSIDNNSGHYKPSGFFQQKWAVKGFQAGGFDTTGAYKPTNMGFWPGVRINWLQFFSNTASVTGMDAARLEAENASGANDEGSGEIPQPQ